MRVALLTGPCPPGKCGVGDYVALLADALKAIGIECQVIDSGDWRILKVLTLHRAIQSQHFDIVQLHYPSLGFGTKLSPQAIALLRGCVITLHETSQVHILRRLAMIPFTFRPKHVIFFSKFERDYGLRWAPWLSTISSIIPPPSNIRKCECAGPRNLSEVVSFGMIRPGNAHDRILRLAALIKSADLPIRVRIIGSPQSPKFIPYFQALQRDSVGLPVIWDHDLAEGEIAKILATASIAYLPYPDGAAELRSSLKAALLNGLAVITTRGSHTPADLEGVVKFSGSPEEALVILRCLLESPAERARLGDEATRYVKDWTWERSAERHTAIYQKILTSVRTGRTIQLNDAQLENRSGPGSE